MMKKKKYISMIVCLVIGTAFILPGCTPESPPLDPIEQSDVSLSGDISNQSADTSKTVSDNKQISINKTETETQYPTLWNDKSRELVEVYYRNSSDNFTDFYSTDEKDLLDQLNEALKGIRIIKESENRSNNKVILLYTSKNDSGRITFEDGNVIIDGKSYEIEGYDRIDKVLKKITDQYPEWIKKYDEWIIHMGITDHCIAEAAAEDTYKNANTKEKSEIMVKLLNKLADEGFVEKSSILASDEMISYSYVGGGLGGIQLKEFDPMMNTIDGNDIESESSAEHNGAEQKIEDSSAAENIPMN